MKLDANCVRDVLLAVESAPYGQQIDIEKLQNMAPGWTENELEYTCLKLKEAGFLDAYFDQCLGDVLPYLCWINCLTYRGHEFLETIRSDSNWEQVTAIAKKAGIFSLKALADIGKSVAQAAVTAALQSYLKP